MLGGPGNLRHLRSKRHSLTMDDKTFSVRARIGLDFESYTSNTGVY